MEKREAFKKEIVRIFMRNFKRSLKIRIAEKVKEIEL